MRNNHHDISIVTPSFNMLKHLKKAAASVADQESVKVEHIIVDGLSNDGTVNWLGQSENIVSRVGKDKGMYDALNKGFAMASAPIVGHLNADEQYLPGTLQKVTEIFRNHPEVDFIVGDFLIVDDSGELLAYRKSFKPKWIYFFSNYLYTLTCTTFYRKRVIEKFSYDISYRSIADMIFMYKVLKAGFKGMHVRSFFSTFTDTGNNLSLNGISRTERLRFIKELPAWYRLTMFLFKGLFYVERWLRGAFRKEREIQYSIYKGEDGKVRVIYKVKDPTFSWDFGKSN